MHKLKEERGERLVNAQCIMHNAQFKGEDFKGKVNSEK